jgi:hypothetical protein
MTIEEAKKLCEEKGIQIKGTLYCDPYDGWIDKSEEYRGPDCGPYAVLCELNIADDLCCEEICGIYPCEDYENNKGEIK